MIKNYKQFESLLDKLQGPTKEDIENRFFNKEIGLFNYLEICRDNNLEVLSNDEITLSLYGKTFNDVVDYFNYLITDIIKIPEPHTTGLITWGKNNKVLFKFQIETKYFYFNPEILTIIKFLFPEQNNKLTEPVSDFVGEQLNSHKLTNNAYPSFLVWQRNWNY